MKKPKPDLPATKAELTDMQARRRLREPGLADVPLAVVLTVTEPDLALRLRELLPEHEGYSYGTRQEPWDVDVIQTPDSVDGHVHMCGVAARWVPPVDLAYVAEWIVAVRRWLECDPDGRDGSVWAMRRAAFPAQEAWRHSGPNGE